MKINEAEQLLGISKANIRFYEKEGLLAPSRTERGYREYTDDDIVRLKQIIILRKLGFSVQQIQEVLDGCITLQEALNFNIQSLITQIDALNGSLALSRQMQTEKVEALDVEYYWGVVNCQEAQGLRFQSILDDYVSFTELNYAWILWPIPGETLRKPRTLLLFLLGISILSAMMDAMLGKAFFPSILMHFLGSIIMLIIWTAIFLPVYLLSKRKPKLANGIMNFMFIAFPIALIVFFIVVFYLSTM